MNAIWNIETAFVFVYAISLVYCYAIYGYQPSKNFSAWAETNPVVFVTLTNLLGLVALARAAFAFSDVFKKSIIELHEKALAEKNNLNTTHPDINH